MNMPRPEPSERIAVLFDDDDAIATALLIVSMENKAVRYGDIHVLFCLTAKLARHPLPVLGARLLKLQYCRNVLLVDSTIEPSGECCSDESTGSIFSKRVFDL